MMRRVEETSNTKKEWEFFGLNKKEFSIGILGIIVVLLVIFSGLIFETNTFGNYQIKQASITGNVTVRNDPGVYLQ